MDAQTVVVYLCCLMVGIAATSFITVLGAAGLAIGLALQKSFKFSTP
jgi:small-conductance mechanosensitive channel